MSDAQKIYAYVDESGQDTKGDVFIVSIVITSDERAEARKLLEDIERISGKGNKKWTKARPKERRTYIELLTQSTLFRDRLYFSSYHETKTFIELTIFSTAKAVMHTARESRYSATVFVDGLRKTERHRFASGLRKLNVRVRKVRGVRDESDAFIRLADAIAGLVRENIDGNEEMSELLHTAERLRLMQEI